MHGQIDETIQEKEAEIARLQAEVERLKKVKPEPAVGTVIKAVNTDGEEEYFINIGDQNDGRDWVPLDSFWDQRRRTAHGRNVATTWLSISSNYPTLYTATWQAL